MTDDEYAAYVRRRMWERTHAGLLEARAERERRRKEEEEEEREKRRVAREMERCLLRGEERRRRRGWRDKWEGYRARWAQWDGATNAAAGGGAQGKHGGDGGVGAIGNDGGGKGGREENKVAATIPWPEGVGDGEGGAIDTDAVRTFFVRGIGLEELGEREFAARLKEERVRWHPDKMQQRLGGAVDGGVMRDVTAVFQVVDALWNDTRKSKD
jgi:hypothetical protein